MTRETVIPEARNQTVFQNYTHKQCKRRRSLIEEVSKQGKQAHSAYTRRLHPSRVTASGISYFGHNIRPRSSSILRVSVATGHSSTRMRQTCTYLVTGNFAILSIIPSSNRKKNTQIPYISRM